MPLAENILGRYALSEELAMSMLTEEERIAIEKYNGAIYDLEHAYGRLSPGDDEYNDWICGQAYTIVPEAKVALDKLLGLTEAIFHSGNDG